MPDYAQEARQATNEVMIKGSLILHKIAVSLTDSNLTAEQFSRLHQSLIDITATFASIQGILELQEKLEEL